jgi:futalosine hydrolase
MEPKNEMLLVCATQMEANRIVKHFEPVGAHVYQCGDARVELLVTGVGMVATTFALTRKLSQTLYRCIINTGIAGSYSPKIKTGEVVYVKSEQFGDLGSFDSNGILSATELGFISPKEFPFSNGKLNAQYQNFSELKEVTGLTVNMVSWSKERAEQLSEKFSAEIETMEGAAFFYVCIQKGIPFHQIRAISNQAGDRDKNNWNIPLALDCLAAEVTQMINKIPL